MSKHCVSVQSTGHHDSCASEWHWELSQLWKTVPRGSGTEWLDNMIIVTRLTLTTVLWKEQRVRLVEQSASSTRRRWKGVLASSRPDCLVKPPSAGNRQKPRLAVRQTPRCSNENECQVIQVDHWSLEIGMMVISASSWWTWMRIEKQNVRYPDWTNPKFPNSESQAWAQNN